MKFLNFFFNTAHVNCNREQIFKVLDDLATFLIQHLQEFI